MALGRRISDRQEQLWTATHRIARSPGHPFYKALNKQLSKAGFDRWVEELCEPCYAGNTGRPGIPPCVYFRSLMAAEGIGEPTDEQVRRFDRKRKGKKLSNEEWESPTDSEGRIGRMKDGRTDIKYDACNAAQLESDEDIIVDADLLDGDQSEADSLEGTADRADENLKKAGCERGVKDVAADRGFHKQEVIESCEESGYRTYIPEKESKHRHSWRDKPPEREKAYRRNRRRTKGNRGRRLQRERSEKVERSFAHIMETGGGRRTTLRGLEPNRKRYKMLAMSYNLGRIMRRVFGVGSPRSLQGRSPALWRLILALFWWIFGGMAPMRRRSAFSN